MIDRRINRPRIDRPRTDRQKIAGQTLRKIKLTCRAAANVAAILSGAHILRTHTART